MEGSPTSFINNPAPTLLLQINLKLVEALNQVIRHIATLIVDIPINGVEAFVSLFELYSFTILGIMFFMFEHIIFISASMRYFV